MLRDARGPEVASLLFPDTLFHPSSTAQRKFWGFEIFSKVLPLLPKDDVPLIFSQNFMKCWMNHLSGEDRYLHKAALKLVSHVVVFHLKQ